MVVTLEFSKNHRFSMRLDSVAGRSESAAGTWTVLSSAGKRQVLQLIEDESQQAVRLKIVFEGDGFVARQEDGDSRIGAVRYRPFRG